MEREDRQVEDLQKEALTISKIATLVVGVCNIYYIGAEYQVDGPLDIAYFIIIMTVFLVSLFWILATLILDIEKDNLMVLVIYIFATLATLAGVICFILSYTKHTASTDYAGGKVISSVLGFANVITYGSCSLIMAFYDTEQ